MSRHRSTETTSTNKALVKAATFARAISPLIFVVSLVIAFAFQSLWLGVVTLLYGAGAVGLELLLRRTSR